MYVGQLLKARADRAMKKAKAEEERKAKEEEEARLKEEERIRKETIDLEVPEMNGDINENSEQSATDPSVVR